MWFVTWISTYPIFYKNLNPEQAIGERVDDNHHVTKFCSNDILMVILRVFRPHYVYLIIAQMFHLKIDTVLYYKVPINN